MDAATIFIFAVLAMLAILIAAGIQAGVKQRKENKKKSELVEVQLKKITGNSIW